MCLRNACAGVRATAPPRHPRTRHLPPRFQGTNNKLRRRPVSISVVGHSKLFCHHPPASSWRETRFDQSSGACPSGRADVTLGYVIGRATVSYRHGGRCLSCHARAGRHRTSSNSSILPVPRPSIIHSGSVSDRCTVLRMPGSSSVRTEVAFLEMEAVHAI